MRLRRPKEGQGYASFRRIIASRKAEDVRINQGYCEGHHHKDIPTMLKQERTRRDLLGGWL